MLCAKRFYRENPDFKKPEKKQKKVKPTELGIE